ncbi:MAG: UDP-N-acetylmuramoyl-L-alanyl-D-glutamate--2,6-diaminopimelate ligase [Bacillota bacterium]|jgi:UDP-N-acetylmuramoyl-L-alanyl-D-glutamate--2,6-diaminopimelate ligase|nr:UDP-N-acetylmuramoyl-L-alanyl-D-glutamate--2,6-diaminopimelate ligase [Candidatus Fermentithermobacillaceae bacterium]
MLLSYLLTGLDSAGLRRDCHVRGITYDSRNVQEGYLFVAIKGFKLDGHAFVHDAFARGASGVVVEEHVQVPPGKGLAVVRDSRFALSHLACKFYRDPSSTLLVAGITGTKGKTTVCHMVKQVLESMGHETGLVGTLHNIVAEEIRPVERTTPEASDLLSLQREMVDKGCTAMAMEVSSHALALHRVAHVNFDIAVFTNIGTDHLDFHQTMENYVDAKAKLFNMLRQGRGPHAPFAVLNRDDPYWEHFIPDRETRVITYGFSENADIRACDPETGPRHSRFTLCFEGKRQEVQIRLPGMFNIQNSLAASAVGLGMGMALDSVAQALSDLDAVRGRAEPVPGTHDFTVWVDYAHTPESLRDILVTARDVADNRVIAVFGCGGDRDKGKRPVMGRIAGELADVVVITNDNPRTENPDDILDQVESGILEAQEEKAGISYLRIQDRREAIYTAISLAQQGDVVVIAGKGHETYQVFADRTVHFDDFEEAAKAIAARNRQTVE